MRVKTIIDEDFSNYKEPAMFIGTVSCDGKCCKEAGIPMSVCQNDAWRESATICISNNQICERYVRNPITKAMVFGGLEPFEQFEEVFNVIGKLIATIKKANNNQKQQTNGSSPKEKHKREPSGWHPGGDPNCGFSNSAGWLSSWTTFSQ